MSRRRPLRDAALAAAVVAALAFVDLALVSNGFASAFVRGAYYRLGDADPGAAAGAVGNVETLDSFSDKLHLLRVESPHYSADVPALGPSDDKLSMAFANIGLGGPAFPGLYGRPESLPAVQQGLALETWVKLGPSNLDRPEGPAASELVAYNGDPDGNGFGFFTSGGRYVVRLASAAVGPTDGTVERDLGPADVGVWHHLGYVYSLGNSSYYFDGKLVGQATEDVPIAPTDGFSIGGWPSSGDVVYGFNGWIDEVRYQTFNPIAAGAFEPTAFLIAPEPAALMFLPLLLTIPLRRPRR